MQYIDTGSRNSNDALGTWLQQKLTGDVDQLRIQSGFFGIDGISIFCTTLERLRTADLPVHIVLGSNDGDTLHTDVVQLSFLMGLPRSAAKIGVVSFSSGYFHPKTYHLHRTDGSQAAYVGSANLGLAGVTSLHVEAGIVLDTREGDPTQVLENIKDAVDRWFVGPVAGFERVNNPSDAARLLAAGILRSTPRPHTARQSGVTGGRVPRPSLQPLLRLPPLPSAASPVSSGGTQIPSSTGTPVVSPAAAPAVISPAVPRHPPFPTYILFASGAMAPTVGTAALSGGGLPGGQEGIVYQLNRDSARHWLGGSGTANISVPVPLLSTLQFGEYASRNGPRPRAEFELEMRYFDVVAGDLRAARKASNIMVYGFNPGDVGHGDVRLVVPRAPASAAGALIRDAGKPLPAPGDCALIQWPTFAVPTIRITLLDRSSVLHQQARNLLDAAGRTNQLVGQGACWLPPGLAPRW